MSVSEDTGSRIFAHKGDRYEIHLEEWANVLLLLEDWGWRLEQRRTFYLATGIDVSDVDARNLAEAGGKLLHAALMDPLSVYPVRADMAKVSEVVEFCKEGGFRIYE